MATRLDTVAPDLSSEITKQSEARLRSVARAVARATAREHPIDDRRFHEAIETLELDRTEAAHVRRAVEDLVNELDAAAWDLQDQDEGSAEHVEYAARFDLARTASTAFWALDPDPQVAASESLYEAFAVLGDTRVRGLLAGLLSSGD